MPKERTDAQRIELILKLHEKFADVLLNAVELNKEILAVLHKEPTIGDKLKEFQTAFSNAWEVRYREPYQFAFVKDVPQMKRLLKQFTMEQLARRISRYVQNEDPFFRKNRHTFGLFVSTINQHAPEVDHVVQQDEMDAEFELSKRRRQERAQ